MLKKSKRLLERHPDHRPVVVDGGNVKLDVVKFLPHKESTVGEFMMSMRNYSKLKESDGFLFFVNNTMPPMTALMGDLYREHAGPDGYLRVNVSKESTFG